MGSLAFGCPRLHKKLICCFFLELYQLMITEVPITDPNSRRIQISL